MRASPLPALKSGFFKGRASSAWHAQTGAGRNWRGRQQRILPAGGACGSALGSECADVPTEACRRLCEEERKQVLDTIGEGASNASCLLAVPAAACWEVCVQMCRQRCRCADRGLPAFV